MTENDAVQPAPPLDAPDPAWNLMTGTVTRYVLLGINIGMGIVLMPFTVRHLGAAEYGLWMLVASMTYYFQLLDLGYGSGVVRHLAEADARRDVTLANQILSTFVVVYGAIGLLSALGVVAIIVFGVPHFPNLSPGQVGRAQILLGILGVRIVVGFPMTVFGAATTARQRFALNNSVAIVSALANGAATYVVLSSGYGLLTLVTCTTGLSLLGYVAYAWTAKIAFPAMRVRPSEFRRSLVRDVTTFSIYLFLIDLAVQIGFNLDNIVVGAALGTTAVAIYAVTLRIADYQRQLCNQFNGLLFPVVVRFGAAGDLSALRRTLLDGTRLALTLVAGVTVCVVGFGAPLVTTWMGPGFEGAVAPLYILALTGVVLVGQGPLGNLLLGTGRHRLVAFAALAEALVNLVLSVVLVRRVGLIGVAIGTLVPVVVTNLFVLMPAACRQVDIRISEFVRAALVPSLAGGVPASLMVVVLRGVMPPDSLAVVVAEGALVGAAFLVCACAFGLGGDDRARYADVVRRIAGRFGLALAKAAHA